MHPAQDGRPQGLRAARGICPNLKVIQIPSAGYEHALPITPKGVALANARGVHDTRTAEMALTLALASQRMFPELLEAQRKHDWRGDTYPPSLADRRVLIVGYGSIGAAIGARMRACEAHVLGVAQTERMAPDGTIVHAVDELPRLLPDAEIVVIVTPLTDATKGLVNAEFLAVDARRRAAHQRGPRAAWSTPTRCSPNSTRAACARRLDVMDPEPLPADHPLWDAPGCIIMPHVGGMTPLTDRRYTDLVRAQIRARLAGEEPVNFVGTGEWVPEPRAELTAGAPRPGRYFCRRRAARSTRRRCARARSRRSSASAIDTTRMTSASVPAPSR